VKKILIFGNSGSGKSTLAAYLAAAHGIAHLDLDSLAWASPGVRKSFDESAGELRQFLADNAAWVIEGCYGSLIEVAATDCNELHFLNPGVAACLANNLHRPWEPHKYESSAAQDKNLDMLQNWVREYESRDDEYSLQYHRQIFDRYDGEKYEHTDKADVEL